MADEISPADVERELLGGDRKYDRREIAELANVDLDRAQELWRALGFADVEDDVKAFTDRDAWALRTVSELGEQGWLDDRMQVAMTRALGQSMGRLADWQLGVIAAFLDPEAVTDQAMARAQTLVPAVEGLLTYVWRRHLAAAAGRALAGGEEEFAARSMAVGFADMVGFTSLTRELDDVQLADLIESFESKAADVIASGGARLVKSIGDEVLFVADDADTIAEVALELSDAMSAVESIPEVRVGLAWGTVLSRLGDVYGEPVNIAARLTSIARPGSILVDRELANLLEANDRYRLRKTPPRPVRGYSMLHASRLRRAE
jgi:adenylate cyclase